MHFHSSEIASNECCLPKVILAFRFISVNFRHHFLTPGTIFLSFELFFLLMWHYALFFKDENRYDGRIRPNAGGDPTEVTVKAFIGSFTTISDSDFTFTVYLRWEIVSTASSNQTQTSQGSVSPFSFIEIHSLSVNAITLGRNLIRTRHFETNEHVWNWWACYSGKPYFVRSLTADSEQLQHFFTTQGMYVPIVPWTWLDWTWICSISLLQHFPKILLQLES